MPSVEMHSTKLGSIWLLRLALGVATTIFGRFVCIRYRHQSPPRKYGRSEDDGEEAVQQPGYLKMFKDGDLDRCGITLLAGKAVGAPFVGGVATCLVLSEVLRLLHGGIVHQVVVLDLQGVEHRSVVPHSLDFSGLNPGYIDVRDRR